MFAKRGLAADAEDGAWLKAAVRRTLCVWRTEIRAVLNRFPPFRVRWDKKEAEVEVSEDPEEELQRPEV